jgi:hypothetical protein
MKEIRMTWEPAPDTPASPVAPVATASRRSSRWLDILLAGAAVLAIAAVAFAVGRNTAPVAAASAFERGGFAPGGAIVRPNGSFDPGAAPGRGFAFGGGLSIDGTVTAIDSDSVTLRLEDGREMTFALDGSTTYHEATDASGSDVAVGDDVAVKVTPGAGRVDASPSSDPGLTAGDVTVTR